jgi:hypothetical protein
MAAALGHDVGVHGLGPRLPVGAVENQNDVEESKRHCCRRLVSRSNVISNKYKQSFTRKGLLGAPSLFSMSSMQCSNMQAFLLHVALHGSNGVVNSHEHCRCSHKGANYCVKQGS